MAIDLITVKSFLRITHDIDNVYLIDLISLSKKFIEEQTGVKYSMVDEVYNQAVLLMVAHFYDNRSPVTEKTVTNVPYSLDCMIKHIGMRGDLVDE